MGRPGTPVACLKIRWPKGRVGSSPTSSSQVNPWFPRAPLLRRSDLPSRHEPPCRPSRPPAPKARRPPAHHPATIRLPAEVAELVDAADSKSVGRKAVWVRAPPSALGRCDRSTRRKVHDRTLSEMADRPPDVEIPFVGGHADVWRLFDDADRSARDRRGLVAPFRSEATKVAGIESRGFILGTASALALGVGFVPIRKGAGLFPARSAQPVRGLPQGRNGGPRTRPGAAPR